MGLGQCAGCWEEACHCADGNGWLNWPLYRLVQIQDSVNTAVTAKRAAGESDGDPWKTASAKPGDPA